MPQKVLKEQTADFYIFLQLMAMKWWMLYYTHFRAFSQNKVSMDSSQF